MEFKKMERGHQTKKRYEKQLLLDKLPVKGLTNQQRTLLELRKTFQHLEKKIW